MLGKYRKVLLDLRPSRIAHVPSFSTARIQSFLSISAAHQINNFSAGCGRYSHNDERSVYLPPVVAKRRLWS
jgi:hypothetical protein